MPSASWCTCTAILVLTCSLLPPVSCRDTLRISDTEVLHRRGDATTTVSVTHSVSLYQQNAEKSPVRPRADRRQRQQHKRQTTDWLVEQSVDADFEWEAYLALNPDLSSQEYGSADRALKHYREFGHQEKRLQRLPEVILRYTAATGLSNQHYCHIAAFSLCAVLGECSIVLPPAVARSSFQDAFSVFREFNKVQWSAMPLETLYDTDKITAEWGEMGFQVWKTPPLQEMPALVEPETAFPRYVEQHDARLVTNVSGVYLRAYDMAELLELVTQAVSVTARNYMLSTNSEQAPYVVVDLPVTLFMIKNSNNLDLVSKVARKIYFAPAVHQLADKVLDGIAKLAPDFNGAHLRVEADAMDWAQSMGGVDVYWAEFLKAMRTGGFDQSSPVYIATGLLTYAAGHETLGRLTDNLTAEGLCDCITYKEQFLDPAELDALHSEQKALLDLLVLAKARTFVGFEPSTFSFFLSQYRVLQGLDPSSSVLVEGKIIGTNPLFEAAAVIVEQGFQQQKQVTEETQIPGLITSRRLRSW